MSRYPAATSQEDVIAIDPSALEPDVVGRHASSPHDSSPDVQGSFVDLDGSRFYRISAYEDLDPFFMTLASAGDVWLFISSSGGLTAGRRDAQRALFPYYTDDKVTESAGRTGGVSLFRVKQADGSIVDWRPFAEVRPGDPTVERALYKDVLGTTLVFEEVHPQLAIRFRVGWQTSARFGVVRTSELTSLDEDVLEVELVDGLVNLLPAGVSAQVQNELSPLLDAYKRTEIDPETGLGLLTLSSTLTDLAEPSECLQVNVAYQLGLTPVDHLLSTRQLRYFRDGQGVVGETDVRGERGAYLVHAEHTLTPGEALRWRIVGDVHYDSADVVALRERLRDPATLADEVEADIAQTRHRLRGIVASTDGLQLTGDELATVHHAANVLFNDMRGGVPVDGYMVEADDVRAFVAERSSATARRCVDVLNALPDRLPLEDLVAAAYASGDADLWRLAREYLPMTFSRRHGDPSRPWNVFQIVLSDEHGDPRLDYQGNWRDIFQNWEALAWSYPQLVESMVMVFLDATTADGYNPYRISRGGIDWEIPEPGNPWSNIGYWSDHQIIYLLKLLETSERFHPGQLDALVNSAVFTHADVPYRIATYEQTVTNPYDTITFDEAQNAVISQRVTTEGADGRLVHTANGGVLHVTLAEKLLLLPLTKLVNLVPDGGIWMNTQRPEWNDANNALVGRGLSVVTLAYLRRYLVFVAGLLAVDVEVSDDLAELFHAVRRVLTEHQDALDSGFDDRRRRRLMDDLGSAGTAYRQRAYAGLSDRRSTLAAADVSDTLRLAQRFVEASLHNNMREDGLSHSYNVLELVAGSATVRRLQTMLEGQVAALSSGLLSPEESVALLGSLRRSDLYRADQHSYLLYPNKDLPGFLERNRFSREQAGHCALVGELLEAGDRSLVREDVLGELHFAPHIRNARDVAHGLDRLSGEPRWHDVVERDRSCLLEIFETVFHHAEFTGRSGTFFAFEGLGSIYWHMVSKLLLAIQETLERAVQEDAEPESIRLLAEAYEDVRTGLGYCKTPAVYGAFPTDPYSHTPADRGARQPGMTGQVKEEVLTRLAELGVRVDRGQIVIRPTLLRSSEWTAGTEFTYLDVHGEWRTVEVPPESFALTFCQVPVVIQRDDRVRLRAHLADGTTVSGQDGVLDADISASVFARDGRVLRLEAFTPSGT